MMVLKRIFLSNIGIFGVRRLVLEGVPTLQGTDKREKESHRLKSAFGVDMLVPRRVILNLRVESSSKGEGEKKRCVCDVPCTLTIPSMYISI